MNAVNARRVLAQTIIIAAAAVGAWQVGLRPHAARVAQAQATLDAERAEVAGYESQRDVQVSNPYGLITDIETRAQRLDELSRRSGRTANLYDMLGGLAARAGVDVERIDPKGSQNPIKDKQTKTGQSVAGTVYAIEINGPYDRVASFLGLLQHDAGLTKVVSFRMNPASPATAADAAESSTSAATGTASSAIVNATIETVHYRLVADAEAGKTVNAAGAKP